jgi:hypothetical protein
MRTSKLHLLIQRRRARLALPRTRLLLAALQQADAARAQLMAVPVAVTDILQTPILPDPTCPEGVSALTVAELTELQGAWQAFHNEGGVTATDFRDWLEGKPITRLAAGTSRNRRHLRLVGTRTGLRLCPAPVDAT